MCDVPDSSVSLQSTSTYTFPIILCARPLTSSQDDQDAPTRAFPSAQTGKHSRDERPDDENEARKRKKHQIEESPRRTERKRQSRSLADVVPPEVVDMLLDMEDAEAEIGPPSPLSGVSKKQQSDPTVCLPQSPNISASGGPAHTISDQSDSPSGPFAAPTAPMMSTQRPTAPQPPLPTDQPAPYMKDVRLEMPHSDRLQKPKTLPPNPTTGIQYATSHTKIKKAARGKPASSGIEQDNAASSTGRQPKPTPTSPLFPRKAASVSSNDDNDVVPLGFAREHSGLSLQGGSLSTNDAYSGPPGKPPTPSLQSTTASNTAREPLPTKMQHATPEPPAVPQALSQPSTPVPRPRIQIPFWIITREPLYTEELWNEGKFQGLLLAEFLDGIAKVTQRGQHIEKVKLTLRTPFSNTILTVHGDAEDAWTTAKAAFAEKLKESRAEARARRVDDGGGYKILIEPFYEQVITLAGGAEADDDVFDY